MLEIIAAILFSVLPQCQTEDSSWCGWDDGSGDRIVNLAPADPAPATLMVAR